MPSHRFEHVVEIEAGREQVWEALQESETWARLGPITAVRDAQHVDGNLTQFAWTARAGFRHIEGTARTRQAMPPELMVIDLDAREVVGVLTADLAEKVDRTNLRVAMAIEARGLMATVFFGAIADAMGKGLGEHLEEFAARLSDWES